MAAAREGIPMVLGDEWPPAGGVFQDWKALKISRDGTQRYIRTYSPVHGAIPADQVGDIPFNVDTLTSENNAGWVVLTGAHPHLSPVPPTPGTDFYAFRKVLDEHAHRILIETNAAHLQMTKETERRIEHIAHELSNPDRIKAGNVSELLRGNVGHLWQEIHAFVAMPWGTTETDAAWRAERDRLKTFIEDHLCQVCAGSGLSYRLINDHPRITWKAWLEAGIRFSVDKEMTTHLMDSGIVSGPMFRSNVRNFNHALQHFALGYLDDDFLRRRSEYETFTPEKSWPDLLGTGEILERLALIQMWGKYYKANRTQGAVQVLPATAVLFRKWCWFNVAALIRSDDNLLTFYSDHNLQAFNLRGFYGNQGILDTQNEYRRVEFIFRGKEPWEERNLRYVSGQTFYNQAVPSIELFPENFGGQALIDLAAAVDSVLGDTTTLPAS